MSINFTFDLQTVTQEYANSARNIAESIVKDSHVKTDDVINATLEFGASFKPSNSKQTEIVSIRDDMIGNGVCCVIWQGCPLITSVKGSLLKNNADGVIFVVAIAVGLARVTLKASEWRALDKRKGTYSGRFLAEGSNRLAEFGVRVDNRNRTGLLATDRLKAIAKKHAKDIAVMKALPHSEGYERTTGTDKGKAPRVAIVCSDTCELGKVLRHSGDSEQLEVIESFACPSCKAKFHLKGTTPKVLTESTEIIKESVK